MNTIGPVADVGAEGDVEVSPEDGSAGDGFMEALFHVFLSLNSAPKALTLALEPCLDRGHVWELLYNLAGKCSESERRRGQMAER